MVSKQKAALEHPWVQPQPSLTSLCICTRYRERALCSAGHESHTQGLLWPPHRVTQGCRMVVLLLIAGSWKALH